MISTREFVIDDYDEAVGLWNLAKGVEIAEGDSREEIRAYLCAIQASVASRRRTAQSSARCFAGTMAAGA